MPAASTAAGNYTVPNLPVGTYELTVKVAGFKAYTHTNLTIAATQTLKQDIPLEVGSATESITVEAASFAAAELRLATWPTTSPWSKWTIFLCWASERSTPVPRATAILTTRF